MQALRTCNAASTRRPALASRSRAPVRVVASMQWGFEGAESKNMGTNNSVTPIILSTLENSPFRATIAAKGAKAQSDYQFDTNGNHVVVVEGTNKDLQAVTITLQEGDTSNAKLNGQPLQASQKKTVSPGDVLQLDGVEYRVTRNSRAHA